MFTDPFDQFLQPRINSHIPGACDIFSSDSLFDFESSVSILAAVNVFGKIVNQFQAISFP
jgi:hypothetical protein